MILSAQSIRFRCQPPHIKPGLIQGEPLISPFHERSTAEGMSFGLSCHGYDVRVAEELHLSNGAFVLASTIERFNMPADLAGFVKDKSSLARQGVCVQNTIIEAGWCGYLTLEITKHSPGYLHLPAGSPIAQIVFQLLDEPTEQVYRGKYQDQEAGPQAARFER
ncbi:MAG: dCTP deaminase [Burkholderiales bacterium]|nr:dCTP deaminase [Burkholderiales bacterium]